MRQQDRLLVRLDRAAPALEQPGPQRVFQKLDLLAHGLGRDRRDHPRDRDRLRLRGLRVREAKRPGLRGRHEYAGCHRT